MCDDEPDCSEGDPVKEVLLDVLKCPDPSILARKQAITCKVPVGVNKGKDRILKSDPKGPSNRLKEFPNESLKVNFNKKHFYEACCVA